MDQYLRIDNASKAIREKQQRLIQDPKEKRLARIERGNAIIMRETAHGGLYIANLTAGDYIGAVPFLDIGHEPHQASVFASGSLATADIDLKTLGEEYEDLSLTLRNLIENVAINISLTTNVAGNLLKRNRQKSS